jgi:hypothetical protein
MYNSYELLNQMTLFCHYIPFNKNIHEKPFAIIANESINTFQTFSKCHVKSQLCS